MQSRMNYRSFHRDTPLDVVDLLATAANKSFLLRIRHHGRVRVAAVRALDFFSNGFWIHPFDLSTLSVFELVAFDAMITNLMRR